MNKLSVLGLRLVGPKDFNKKSIEELGLIDFHLVVTRSTPADPLFFSTPRLRESLMASSFRRESYWVYRVLCGFFHKIKSRS